MRILYIITQSSWGGAQNYVFTLTSALAKNPDLKISVAGGRESKGELANRLSTANINFIPVKNLVREIDFLTDLKAVWELKKLIETEKPDIIHLNSTKAGVVGSLAGKLAKHKAKIIYTVHGWVFNEDLSPLKKSIYFWIEKITASLKDKFICLSDFDRQIGLNKKITPADKTAVIYNGLDAGSLDLLSPEEAIEKLLGDQSMVSGNHPVIIGTVANFYPAKALNYLIDAVNIMITDYRLPITAVIIGDGDLRSQLEQQIKQLKLENNIFLAGKMKNAAQYLKAFDIAVMSSVKEGVPYFLLEAMSAGLPIVSTNVGGIPEIVIDNETGLLAEPKNSIALAEKIKFLIDQPELRQKMGQAGLLRVKKEFNLNQTIDQTFSLYSAK